MHTYSPGPPLADFVEAFWQADGPAPAHAQERLLPTGTMELVISLRDDALRIYDREDTKRYTTLRGIMVCGVQSGYFVIDTADSDAVLGVHFKPGGAFPFLGLPAGDLHDAHVSLEALWGLRADALRSRLIEAGTPAARFRILERELLAAVRRPLVRHPAVGFALGALAPGHRPCSVGDVTAASGLCPRRFIQVFKDQVGLTPKLYARVQRFQQVLHRVHRGRTIEWAGVAQMCGYYDQAHFIHDFRTFSGLNPSAYLVQRGDHLNHVPIPD